MKSKSIEERIKELKELRSELMSVKDYMSSQEDDGSNDSSSINEIRKSFTINNQISADEQKPDFEDAKQVLYSQYESIENNSENYGEENAKEKSMTLKRGR